MNSGDSDIRLTKADMATYIDHTLLKQDAGPDDLEKLCQEAVENNFRAVCLNSGMIHRAGRILDSRSVEICSVVGFPLGAMESRAKAFEAENAIQDGATEIDMVLNLGLFKHGQEKLAKEDISMVRKALGPAVVLKVIIETCLLNREQIVLACKLAQDAGADFVKTSTGFAGGGAFIEDVALMRRTVGPDMGVKASGGIKNWATALAMIQAGASRIGTSSGVEILSGAPDQPDF